MAHPFDHVSLRPAEAAGAVPADEADVPAVSRDANGNVFRHAQQSRGSRDYQILIEELVSAGFIT